jgi:hypothetical protein
MGYVCQRVEVVKKVGDDWTGTTTVLSDAYDVQVRRGVGKIKDTFSFKINRGRDYFALGAANPLQSENLVKIYFWRDSTIYADTDLEIQGTIEGVTQKISSQGDLLVVTGNNFSEMFFDVMLPLNERQKTWVEIIKKILLEMRRISGAKVFWAVNGVNGWTGASNPNLKNDGTSNFPKKDLVLNYTRISEMLDNLTSDEYTSDGKYIYWLEPEGTNYYFRVAFKSSSVAGTLTQGENSYDLDVKKSKEDVKNWVVYNCGTDLYGHSVEDLYYDVSSIGENGMKQYYATEETQDLFNNLWNTERNNPGKISSFNPDADGFPQDDFPTAYNYTFLDGTVVSSDKEFNDHLKSKALEEGRRIAVRIVDFHGKPLYQTTFNMLYTKNYVPGENWFCVIPWRGVERNLRVNDLMQTIAGSQFVVEEDERNAGYD